MVKHAEYRQDKYIKKIIPEVVKERFDIQKQLMLEQASIIFAEQTALEEKVGKILNEKNLYGLTIHHYRNFSQELYSLSKRFENGTLNKEATLLAKKWLARGLDINILKEIAKLFNIILEI